MSMAIAEKSLCCGADTVETADGLTCIRCEQPCAPLERGKLIIDAGDIYAITHDLLRLRNLINGKSVIFRRDMAAAEQQLRELSKLADELAHIRQRLIEAVKQ